MILKLYQLVRPNNGHLPKDMTTTRTERSLDALEKNHKILCEKLDSIQAGLKDVLDAILSLTTMVAAIQGDTVSEVSQETSADSTVVHINNNHCAIKGDKYVNEGQATEIPNLDTKEEAVLLNLQPQVHVERWPKVVCGKQKLTDVPPYLDFDEDDFIVLEGLALE